MSKNEEEQARKEREIFGKFLEARDIQVTPDSYKISKTTRT